MNANSWFDEKAQQVDTPSMLAFGISITTRHAKARELSELLMFALEAARANVNELVEEAFYDSNSQCCAFKLRTGIDEYSPQAEAILAAAKSTISQFDWFGYVQHGRGAPDENGPF